MAEEILPAGPTQIIQQVKLACYELGKAFDKQTKKHVYALKSLNLSNKTDELKQIKGIFPKNLFNDLTTYKSQEIIRLQDVIKSNEVNYKSKRGKTYNFNIYPLTIVFSRHIRNKINMRRN